MRINEIIDYFAEQKIRQWLREYDERPEGKRNRIDILIFVNPEESLLIPCTFRAKARIKYKAKFAASLN